MYIKGGKFVIRYNDGGTYRYHYMNMRRNHAENLDAFNNRTIGGVTMANKANFARQGQQMAASFSALADDILSLQNIYWDRGYNSGGADPLADADVEALASRRRM